MSPLRNYPPLPPGTVAWLENHGSGQFVERILDTDQSSVESITVSDFDSDGDQDILAGVAGTHGVTLFRNDGSESFVAEGIRTPFDASQDLLVTDLDGDQVADFVVAGRRELSEPHSLMWFRPSPDSAEYTTTPIETAVRWPRHLTTADLDHDGDLDVVSVSRPDIVAWHENRNDGSFRTRVISEQADSLSAIEVC